MNKKTASHRHKDKHANTHASSWGGNTTKKIALLGLLAIGATAFFLNVSSGRAGLSSLFGGVAQRIADRPATDTLPAFSPMLMIGTPEPLELAGYTIATLDLKTGVITDLPAPGCFDATGFALNPATGKVMIACVGGSAQFWQYDIASGAITQSLNVPFRETFRAGVVCASAGGGCFYTRGSPDRPSPGHSDSELMVVGPDNVVRSILAFPDQKEDRVPDRLRLVEVEGKSKLFILSRASEAAVASAVHRYDIATGKFDLTCFVNADSQDMEVADGRIYISMTRGPASHGKDILVLDANTCAQLGSITMPKGGNGYQPATALRITSSGLYVGGLDGVYMFSVDTLKQKGYTLTSSFLYEGAAGNGRVYMTMPNDTIFEFDSINSSVTRTFNKRVNAGKIAVIEHP